MTTTTTVQPPHSLEAEQAVLGAILIFPKMLMIASIEEGLRPEDFYRERHAVVYSAMLALADRDVGIDVLTVSGELERTGRLQDAGGMPAVDAMAAAIPAMANARAHVRRVVELAQLRVVMTAGYELVAAADGQNHKEIAAAERKLAQRARSAALHTVDGDAWRNDVTAYLEADNTGGWEFPWPKFNRAMGGMRRGETTAVGAWTNFGKSPLIDQILAHAADQGANAHLYSNEGSRQQRALRNTARIAGVSLTSLTRRELTEPDMRKVLNALEKPLPFGYTEATGWTADEIARDMRWRRYDVVALDMLHNIDFREERELASMVNTLVAAAIIADSHLLLAVHFNEERAKNPILPVPVLRDIRGSGMIKNRVDNVLFLHRQQELDQETETAIPTDEALAFFPKIRYGEKTGVNLVFNGAYQRFLPDDRRPHEVAA